MPNKNLEVLFPGQKKRWIRVLLKGKKKGESAQMKLELFDDLPFNDSPSINKTLKANLKKSSIVEKSNEQLTLNLFDTEIDS